MVEGILVFLFVTSYGSIIKIVADDKYFSSKYNRSGTYLYWFCIGWFVFPFWAVYKFWEWMLVGLPKQIKEWSRKRNDK